MKVIFIAVAAFAACVVAQTTPDLSKVPSCALPCVQPVLVSGYGNCKAGDVECICKNQEAQSTIGTCLQEKCSASDQKTAIQFADSLCQSAGVTIPTTIAPQTTGATTTHATGTGTITSAPTTATTTTAHSNTTANHTTTTTHSTATGAAATGYVANGLGVAGAAVAAFFFL